MLTTETASRYIADYHAPFGGARIAWARNCQVDGIPMVQVKFWHGGGAFFADVWVESGRLYGEW